MKKLKTLNDLLVDQLRDLYYAEKLLVKALPKMAKRAYDEELKTAFKNHLDETETHIERLEQAFEELEVVARSKKCPAMEGIIEEGKEMMEIDADPAVIDAGLIASAQKVEHYEMASYGCVRTYAKLLGFDKIEKLLQKTLDEEMETDKKLSEIAESINVEALEEK